MTDPLPDGIFFDLPMDVYVAQPRLGAHGLGKLLVSAATFWESSHLNPAPREVSAAVEATRTIGSAYHCARLEPEHFEARYVREPDKADMPEGSLFTGIDMGAELERRGLKKSGSVAEQAERLATADFPVDRIWPLVLGIWQDQLKGRTPLSPKVWDEIVTDGERLRQSPDVAALIDGGFAEVSILWTDERGVPCKCRPDKLAADRWIDLKSFSNPRGKHVEQAIADQVRYYRYHVGAAHYRDGIEMVRGGNLQIVGEATGEQRALVAAMQMAPEELACWYIFQEKGGVPFIVAKQFRFHEVPFTTEHNAAMARDGQTQRHVEVATRTPSLWWERARREIRKAKSTFQTYSEVYAPGEPWLPFNPLGEISDLSFSAWFLDEEIGE